jgi:hypothetical protein
MTTQKFFTEWADKHPKSFSNFFSFLDDYFFNTIGKALFKIKKNNNSIDIMLDEYVLPFEMLTGIIEKFFIENESLFYNSKQEAQISAYLKAAEILEKELKK